MKHKVLTKEDADILISLSRFTWSAWLFSMFELTARSARQWPGTRPIDLPYDLTPEDALIDFNLRYRREQRWLDEEDGRILSQIDDATFMSEDGHGS